MISTILRLIFTIAICIVIVLGGRAKAGLGAQATLPADSQSAPDEYVVKAALLYNFAKFAKWPAESFADPISPLQICVLGKDPFGATLDTLVGKRVRNRQVATSRFADVRHVKKCHLLFIAESEQRQVTRILEYLRDLPVLTIADMPNFVQLGGIISLKIVKDRIRFEINIAVSKRVHLNFSSDLLMSADVIIGETTWRRFNAPFE